VCQRRGLTISTEIAITSGCHFGHLQTHLLKFQSLDALLIGVDAGSRTASEKIDALRSFIHKTQPPALIPPLSFAVPAPCVEEWMMADPAAVFGVLEDRYDVSHLSRPAFSKTERRTKRKLGEWVESMLGFPLQRNGAEYAEEIGIRVDPVRLQGKRVQDLLSFIEVELPRLLS